MFVANVESSGNRIACDIYLALVSKLGRAQPTPTGVAAGSSRRAFSSGLQWGPVAAAYPAWFPNNVARNSPASISDFEITSLGLQCLWRMLKVQAIELRATFIWRWSRSLAGPSRHPLASQLGPPAARSRRDSSGVLSRQPIPHGSPTMSHVIPPREFQTLKSCCWNCNVCGMSRKMTKLNYVRLWGAQSQFIRASSAAQCR